MIIHLCKNCGESVEENFVYCPACGQRLARGERVEIIVAPGVTEIEIRSVCEEDGDNPASGFSVSNDIFESDDNAESDIFSVSNHGAADDGSSENNGFPEKYGNAEGGGVFKGNADAESNSLPPLDIFESDDNAESDIFHESAIMPRVDLCISVLKAAAEEGEVSCSFIQRRFCVGYGKACKVIEWLQKNGFAETDGKLGKHKMLISSEEVRRLFGE